MRTNISWTEARDLLLDTARPAETETCPLDACAGRVLGFELRAAEDVPPFDRSAYDGYAFRSADLAEASKERPVTLRITETVAAGSLPARTVTTGTAARVMTGAPIPPGADCVINFERAEFTEEMVTVFRPLFPGDNIVRRGEDVAAGTLLAARGTVIDAGLAGTLAAQGISRVPVYRKLRIGLISTGSEVVEADRPQSPGKIRNANRASFTALLRREGCETEYLGLAGDEAEEIADRIREGLRTCDAVLLTGGVSVGQWDVTPEAMRQAGAEILARGVDMKPGMACAYGLAGNKPVWGLSGNPASALTNFAACVLPALRKMQGRAEFLPREISARMMEGFPKKSPAVRFLRGRLELAGEEIGVRVPRDQGNAVLSSVIGCDAFVIVPAGSGPVEAGTRLKGFVL